MWLYRSLHCLPGRVASYWDICLDGVLSAQSSVTHIASPCCASVSAMGCCPTSRSGMTPPPSIATPGVGASMSSARASRASRSHSQARGLVAMTAETAGRLPLGSFQRCARAGRCWRTSQLSLLPSVGVTSPDYSVKWPRWGIMRDGVCWELSTLAPHISAIAGGPCLPERMWPTPTVCGLYNRPARGKKCGTGLATAVRKRTMRLIPTPTAHDARDLGCSPSHARRHSTTLPEWAGGALSPMWTAWLMGWPIGHSSCEPLATDRWRAWERQHGSLLAALWRGLRTTDSSRASAGEVA